MTTTTVLLKENYNRKVVDYYQNSQWLYKLFCYDANSLGMHFGFWYENTKNRQEAITNQDKAIVQTVNIKKGEKVLDAGCGVGGTAIFIAKSIAASVTGISLDPLQVEAARKNAISKNIADKTAFLVGDYTQTSFPDESFDVVYGNESVCYASPKKLFLDEAYRVLKPGGRLVIADGYSAYPPKNTHEKEIIDKFKDGFALNELITPEEMKTAMLNAGFESVIEIDKTEQVAPSIKDLEKIAYRFWFIASLLRYLPIPKIKALYKNAVALKMAGEAYKMGLAAYWIHAGVKPN